MRAAVQIALLVVLGVLGAPVALAQDTTCNAGDIAWVVSTVDANVGTGLGSGRCTTNTVSGAAYNDITMPWGVQAALDCACSGLEIRVLGDTGDYGIATDSWNNRFDATSSVVVTVPGTPLGVLIVGYADQATACLDNNEGSGCPVELNFSGQSAGGDGLRFVTGTQTSLNEVRGLHIANADDDCIRVESGETQLAGLEVSGCGGDGLDIPTGHRVEVQRTYFHDVGNDGAVDAVIRLTGGFNENGKSFLFNYIFNSTAVGAVIQNIGAYFAHNIFQDIGADCVQNGGIAATFDWNTFRDCNDDAFDVVPGASTSTRALIARFNLITGAGGWAFNDLAPSGRYASEVSHNVMGGNASGGIAPAAQPIMVEIGNVTGVTPAYVSPTDSTPDGPWAAITLSYPRGTTEITINAGAIVESSDTGGGSGGGGGVFIPGGPR